jgi:hypothetical protein
MKKIEFTITDAIKPAVILDENTKKELLAMHGEIYHAISEFVNWYNSPGTDESERQTYAEAFNQLWKNMEGLVMFLMMCGADYKDIDWMMQTPF